MKPQKDINIIKDLISEFGTNNYSIPEYVLLYDNYGDIDPIRGTLNQPPCKVEQMVLILITQGEITLNVNSETVTLQKKTFIYITPDSIVQYKASSSDFKYILYVMYPPILKDAFYDLGLDFNLLALSHTFKYSQCDDEAFKYRIDIYNELKEELLQAADMNFKKLFARAYVNIIIINNINLLNLNVIAQGNKISRQMNVYRKFLELLNQYSDMYREVQFYAAKLDITPKYLSAVTIEYSNKNASGWIDEYVITKAKTLLREQQYNIKDVSEMLNFPSQSFFGRYFKRVTGMSPKQFVQNRKNNSL